MSFYPPSEFNQIDPDKEIIDSVYVKVAFDPTGELGESELKFATDVNNTIFRGIWRAQITIWFDSKSEQVSGLRC